MPTYRGENTVLRLLPVKKDKIAQLSCLGFSERQLFDIDRALCKTSGIILITGPTGSGKTTTLNACLQKKSIEPLSIITLEDPIEYEVDGIRQVHVRQNHGFTFAKALRACLRQDPDIIMVGEIRDRETAEIAIHTSLTGHLVLSTIHSGRAKGVLTRLMNMGIEKYLLFETLNLIIAQRLVRSICMICHGEGCEKCRSTGYGGRIVISEHISFDWFRDMTMHQKINMDISQELIMQKGFVSLEEDGRNKVIQGLTKDSEIIRVLME
jgi:type II secretory ATPase GspE/PulE/Tfp pilus assembly ATPase PilB-like protein